MKSVADSPFAYAELDVKTNFSFLRGASHPDELVYRAAELGYRAIGVTDFNSLAGIVRMHQAAKEVKLKLLVGTRLVFSDAPDLLVWAPDRAAYAGLCRLLTLGKRRTEKGECELRLADFLENDVGLLAAVVMDGSEGLRDKGTKGQRVQKDSHLVPLSLCPSVPSLLSLLRDVLSDRLSLAISCARGTDDDTLLREASELSRVFDIPLLATNDVYYHDPSRRRLQDVLTCVRHGCTIGQAGFKLFPNAERHLKSPEQMHRLFADYPHAIHRGLEIAERCNFSLDSLRYEYPDELVPAGKTPSQYLAELTWAGAAQRYPSGIIDKVRRQIEHELRLIEQLKFETYFLTVYDLVRFARSRDILCQGRGSAANSAVCYCIGVTSVDPARIDVLFERFISAARNEPPDIDVDFEHERREEVIQYVYQKYGRDRAGMTATIITYRGRSAIRDVGKALGLSLDMVDSMANKLDWWDRGVLDEDRIRQCGLDPADKTIRRVIALASELLGFPRHLSQHVGGLVMTRGPLSEMVPIENASMEDRTVIEWDKDDIDALGLLKVDVLALGMLTCISKAFKLIEGTKGQRDKGTKGKGRTYEREEQKGENISRPDRVATRNGTCQSGASGDCSNAAVGAIRTSQPNVESSVCHPVQRCGRLFAPDEARLSEIPAHFPGLSGRTLNTIRAGNQPANHCTQSSPARIDRRRRSDSPGTDHELGEKDKGGAGDEAEREEGVKRAKRAKRDKGTEGQRDRVEMRPSSLSPSVPPTLCPFVPLSLSPSPSPPLELHTVPPEDPAVYDMMGNADTVGVFQIESRAQMAMLPRLRPRCFYDLVIEVAIVRPGPIQGNMVHPYLKRRSGEEPVTFPSKELEQVLQKTLGVPLFQEQAMKISMVAAGFSAEEADKLRRAMAAWRRSGVLDTFHKKIVEGMVGNGYQREFAEQCFLQIKGFGEYGFPESHAASFALLVYVSAWLKRHHPAAFAAALINSQPMGFYQPAQIVRDARDHGVEVRAADVNESEWDCTLEERDGGEEGQRDRGTKGQSGQWGLGGPVLRLGFRQIRGLRQVDADRIVANRKQSGRFVSIPDFHQRTGLSVASLRILAEADAFSSLTLSRRQALWEMLRLKDEENPLFEEGTKGVAATSLCPSVPLSLCPSLSCNEPQVCLPIMPLGQEVMIDYSTTGLSLKKHPVALVREELQKRKIIASDQLAWEPHGRWVKVAGLVLIRQRPGTASGIVFETLEDETGIVNLIVKPDIYDRYRPAARHAGLLQAEGYVQRSGQIVHVLAKRLFDLSDLLAGYELRSRDFH